MSNYKEGQQVNTPQGQGRIAADQVTEQVYVLLTDTGNVETFDEREVEPEHVTDISAENALPAEEAKSFDFDEFLKEENKDKPTQD